LLKLDENFTAPMNGYGSLEEYYEACSWTHRLDKIHTPHFNLCAEDDQIDEQFPAKEVSATDFVMLGKTKAGGHCGHFSGMLKPTHWFQKPIISYFDHFERKNLNQN